MTKLILTYRRGSKRVKREFPITQEQASDPALRADLISRHAAFERLLNWEIVAEAS